MYQKTKQLQNYILAIMMMLFLVSCAGYNKPIIKNTYKVLNIAQISYDNTMKSVAILYKDGKITTKQKNKIIKLGKDFVASYKVTVDVLADYDKGVTNGFNISETINDFINVEIKFMNAIKEIKNNG